MNSYSNELLSSERKGDYMVKMFESSQKRKCIQKSLLYFMHIIAVTFVFLPKL